MTFFLSNCFSKCEQISIVRWLCSHLLKKTHFVKYEIKKVERWLLGLLVLCMICSTLSKKWSSPLRISSVNVRRKLRICSYLLKKSVTENVTVSGVYIITSGLSPYKQFYQNIWHDKFPVRGLFAFALTIPVNCSQLLYKRTILINFSNSPLSESFFSDRLSIKLY